MTWLDSTLDKLASDIEVDVSEIGLTGEDGKTITTLLARPLSAQEYQVLKSEPEIRNLHGQDRTELLGLRMTYEMLAKCDSTLKWGQFKRLPLTIIGAIALKVGEAVGQPLESGGGVLGEV